MRSLKCLWSFLMEDLKQRLVICTEREIKLFKCLKERRCGHEEESKAEVIRTWHLVQGVGGASLGIFEHLQGI